MISAYPLGGASSNRAPPPLTERKAEMANHDRGGWNVDPEIRSYLESFKADLIEEVRNLNKQLSESLEKLFNAYIDPIKETMRRHTDDIRDLYDHDRQSRDKLSIAETKIDTLEDKIDKHIEYSGDDDKFKRTQAVAIVAVVASVLGVAAAVLIAVFTGG